MFTVQVQRIKDGPQKRGKENDTKMNSLKNIPENKFGPDHPATRQTKTSQCECLAQSQCEKLSQCELPTSVVKAPSQCPWAFSILNSSSLGQILEAPNNMSLLGTRVAQMTWTLVEHILDSTQPSSPGPRIFRSKPAGTGGSCKAFLKLPAFPRTSDFQKWLDPKSLLSREANSVCLKFTQLNGFPRRSSQLRA